MNLAWPTELPGLAPAGYYIALRVGFAYPMDEHNAFPDAWVDHYTRNGFMLRDPAVRWAYANNGEIRWSALEEAESSEVLAHAARFGLRYGAVVSHATSEPKEQRSYGTFAREDREFTDEEISLLRFWVERLHDEMMPRVTLTDAETEALKLVKEGLRLKEIAWRLGVSEGAIKQRLAGAKKKLGAKTSSHAITLAVESRLI